MDHSSKNLANPKPIHTEHRKRMKQKFLQTGIDNFADHEILELLLFFSIPRRNVNPLAHQLIRHFGSFNSVLEASVDSLMQVDGMGENSATLINLLYRIFNKYSLNTNIKMKLSSSSTAKAYCKRLFTETNIEQFFVVCVNSASKIISHKKFGEGSMSKVNVNIRDITSFALSNNCERIILTHNHPNERCMPSDDDITFTKTIILSCLLNDIQVLDHIIVCNNETCSFADLKLVSTLTEEVLDAVPGLDKKKKIVPLEAKNYSTEKP